MFGHSYFGAHYFGGRYFAPAMLLAQPNPIRSITVSLAASAANISIGQSSAAASVAPETADTITIEAA